MHVSKWHFPLTLRFFFFTRGKENRSKIQILSFRFLSERQNRNIEEYSPVVFGGHLTVILVWFPFVNQPSDRKTAAVLCLSSKKLSALPSWVVIPLLLAGRSRLRDFSRCRFSSVVHKRKLCILTATSPANRTICTLAMSW